MFFTLLIFLAIIVCKTAFLSFFEWTLHKYPMHRPIGKFRYAFEAHATVHHQVFKFDNTYHLQRDEDKMTIPMAWWNGPLLVILTMIPEMILYPIIFDGWMLFWTLFTGVLLSGAYYGIYEYLHWCMHLPKARRVEMSWLFYRLNGHHLLHHRYMHKNFNVVLPLADLCLGTLMLRAKTRFAQARGPSVPDVQPLVPVCRTAPSWGQ
jgi:hypothetical protein